MATQIEKKGKRSKQQQAADAKNEEGQRGNEKQYTEVSFVCQNRKCLQPLVMDKSLSHFPLPVGAEGDQTEQDQHRKEWASKNKAKIVEESVEASLLDYDDSSSRRMKAQLVLAEEYFSAISSASPVDHPLCKECAKDVLDALENQILFSEESKIRYESLLRKLESEFEADGGEDLERQLEEQVVKLQEEEEKLIKELQDIEEERKVVKSDIKTAKDKIQELEAEDLLLHSQFNIYQGEMLDLQDQVRSIEYQTQHANSQLKKLKKTNVFSMTFNISHQGLFGTINGFRLGRLTTVQVDWSEINVAWGQCALLLRCLQRNADIQFKSYTVVPYGNHSHILLEQKEGKSPQTLPLYTSGGIRFMLDSKFDKGMVAYLECLNQLKRHIERTSGTYKLPYRIEKDLLVDDMGKMYSIKMQGNSPEHWTKASKFMLTNLQWAIGWQQVQNIT